jgi:hypothetical protein
MSRAPLAISVANNATQTIDASSGTLNGGLRVFTVSSLSFVNGATRALCNQQAFIGIEKSQLTLRRLYESKSHASDSHSSGEAAILRGAPLQRGSPRKALGYRSSREFAQPAEARDCVRSFGG